MKWGLAAFALLALVAVVGFALKMVGLAVGLLLLGAIVGTLTLWSYERPAAPKTTP